jgi:hypothetical protein
LRELFFVQCVSRSVPDRALVALVIIRSTGPPGTTRVIANTSNVMPIKVGITSSRRLRK